MPVATAGVGAEVVLLPLEGFSGALLLLDPSNLLDFLRRDFLGLSLSVAEEVLLLRLFCRMEDDDDFFSSSFLSLSFLPPSFFLSLSFLPPSFSVLDFLRNNLFMFYYCDDLLSLSLSLSHSAISLLYPSLNLNTRSVLALP